MRLFFSALLCALMLLSSPAEAAKAKHPAKTPVTRNAATPPDAFLREVYDHYIGEYSRGLPLRTDKDLRKVFTADLTRLIEADRRRARGEVGNLDGDPFVDAQDWKISNMRIAIENETPASATATARFENMGEEKQVVLLLVRGNAGWRVNEIVMPGSGSLRKLLSGPQG